MNARYRLHAIEHAVHRGGGPFPFIRAARQVRLVDLHDIRIEVAHLRGKRIGDRHREIGQTLVMNIVKHLGQHMRTGQRELERPVRQLLRTRAGLRQIERARPNRAVHHGRRARSEFRRGLIAVDHQLFERDPRTHTRHRFHEILDHPVGFGMVDVEPVQLSVRHQVDPRQFLGVEHDRRRVPQRLLAGERRQPVRDRITPDHRRLDLAHRSATSACSEGSAPSQSGKGYEPTTVVLIRGSAMRQFSRLTDML